jgi:hypothetical protein
MTKSALKPKTRKLHLKQTWPKSNLYGSGQIYKYINIYNIKWMHILQGFISLILFDIVNACSFFYKAGQN